MKMVLISAYRIKQYFINNKLIFFLYLIGSIFCGLLFIYFYGNGVSYMRNSLAQDLIYRQYTVDLAQSSMPELSEDIVTFFNSPAVEDVLFGANLPTEKGNSIRITGIYKNKLFRYTDKGRIYFSEDEISECKTVVVLPSSDYTEIGNHITLFDSEFEVIGRAYTHFGEYCIPFTTFCMLNVQPSFLKVISAERQNLQDDSVLLQLQILFPDAQIYPPTAEQSEKSRAGGEIFFVCAVYAVCMLTFAFLVKYMVELSAPENIICMIVGASKAKLLQLLLMDTFFLSAVSAGLSILIHYLCRDSIFSHINQAEILYTASDYLLFFLFMLAISILMIIPFICIICKNSINKAKNIYVK